MTAAERSAHSNLAMSTENQRCRMAKLTFCSIFHEQMLAECSSLYAGNSMLRKSNLQVHAEFGTQF